MASDTFRHELRSVVMILAKELQDARTWHDVKTLADAIFHTRMIANPLMRNEEGRDSHGMLVCEGQKENSDDGE